MSGLNLTLKIWRQKDAKTKGQFETVKMLSRHQRYAARS